MKYWIMGLAGLTALGALALTFRLSLVMLALTISGTPPLSQPVALGDGERWFDDYYTIEEVAPDTFAIGEPLYHQQNYSYLIIGKDRALLFDSGTPMRDISRVVASLTQKPVTVLASHLHFDHVGNHHRFERVAMLDTQRTRAQLKSNSFQPERSQHLGQVEDFEAPTWTVSEWLPDQGQLELGERRLEVLATPGHTDQSVSLYDKKHGLLFTGDYLYDGPLFALLGNSSLEAYLDTAVFLRDRYSDDTRLLTAHRTHPPGAPIMDATNLGDLANTLTAIKSGDLKGKGLYPTIYPINDEISLMTDLPWFHDWDEAD